MAAFRVLSFLLRLPHFFSLIISLCSCFLPPGYFVICLSFSHSASTFSVTYHCDHVSHTYCLQSLSLFFYSISWQVLSNGCCFLFSILHPFRICGPILQVFSCHPWTSSPIYCHRCIVKIFNPLSTVSDLISFHQVLIHQQQAKCCFTH